MNEITTQRLHSQPNISMLWSGVFIRGDLMLKIINLYTVKVTSSNQQHLHLIENILLLTKELKFGTIFSNNIKNLDLRVPLNQYQKILSAIRFIKTSYKKY